MAAALTRDGPAPVSSFWDSDTQAFNVATEGRRPPPPSGTSSVRAPRRPPPPSGPPSVARQSVAFPTTQAQLPKTREGFDALARAINAAGGINGSNIQVYASSSVANIRKNFVKRLGLAGK